jgi:hypothetical protein
MNIHLDRYKQQILESIPGEAPQQGGSQAIDILKDACFSLEPKDQAIIIQALEGILNSRNNEAAGEFVDSFYDAIYDLQDPDQNRPPFDGYDPDSPESLSHMINKKRTS